MTENSLLKAIFQYRADWNAYLAASLDDDDAPRSYVPSLHRLEEWSVPAGDRNEAAEALRVALEFYGIGDSDVIPAMMKAALGFLGRERRMEGVAPSDSGLCDLIDAFGVAKAAYDATDRDGDSPEWEAYEAAELAVLMHPCQTLDDVRAKARFFIEPCDTIRKCSEEGALLPFLRSLLGEAQS